LAGPAIPQASLSIQHLIVAYLRCTAAVGGQITARLVLNLTERVHLTQISQLRIDVGSKTDIGRVRQNNEDAFAVVPDIGLWVISDGMGGETHGELASAIAIETIVAYCRQSSSDLPSPNSGESWPDISKRGNRLLRATHLANREIFNAASQNSDRRGMGATVVAAWLEENRLSLVNVGDSRAYFLHSGEVEQLTADHTLVAEQVRRGIISPTQALTTTLQNVLIRALGAHADVEPDIREFELNPDGTLLLCTDGLTRMVDDSRIAKTILAAPNAQSAADQLVNLANECGGQDNVTVIVVQFGEKS
jgi:serine/threonine protein phosphatase PrpC